MKIIVESHIPYVDHILDGLGTVVRLDPEEITPQAVADADALIVRTRTRCNASLLEGSRVRFVATATIGTDHIDLRWCAAQGITTVSAPGCNAPAVAQYVWASVLRLIPNPRPLTIGIVGVGHVGTIVAEWARRLGVKVLLCDPPRARREGPDGFVSLDRIAAEADIITFHTPFTADGPDRTRHMADDAFFASLKHRPMVINAARGPVVDNQALVRAIRDGLVSHAVVDCWEGEPSIDPTLLSLVDIATPHIAGYSIEGKQRATAAVVTALCRYAGAPIPEGVPVPAVSASGELTGEAFAELILASYDPLADTAALRAAPGTFESLRNHYPLRHEV